MEERSNGKSHYHWYTRWWGIVITVIFVILAGGFTGLVVSSAQKVFDEQTVGFTMGQGNSSSVNIANGDAASSRDDPFFGNQAAQVVIVEFGDYQCPYCEEVFATVRQIMNQYRDQVLFVFRDYPVSDRHPLAQYAAEASMCAWEQGSNQYWALHDRMFLSQESLSRENIIEWAEGAGLSVAEFTECLNSRKYQQEVLDDHNDGVNLGVRGTPTFFINGRKIEGVIPYDIFVQIIKSQL
ncbi:MAG: DsbA family protein [bacterium]